MRYVKQGVLFVIFGTAAVIFAMVMQEAIIKGIWFTAVCAAISAFFGSVSALLCIHIAWIEWQIAKLDKLIALGKNREVRA